MKFYKNKGTAKIVEVIDMYVRDRTPGRQAQRMVLFKDMKGNRQVRTYADFRVKFEEVGKAEWLGQLARLKKVA